MKSPIDPRPLLEEYRSFAVKGNVIDVGVGIVIGAAFTSIVNSLVADVINPIIGAVTGGVDFSNLFVNLGPGDYASLAEAQAAGAPTLNYGLFINALISFVIVSWALFLVMRNVNRLRKLADEKPQADPEPAGAPEPPVEVRLLTEIRDLLRDEGRSGGGAS